MEGKNHTRLTPNGARPRNRGTRLWEGTSTCKSRRAPGLDGVAHDRNHGYTEGLIEELQMRSRTRTQRATGGRRRAVFGRVGKESSGAEPAMAELEEGTQGRALLPVGVVLAGGGGDREEKEIGRAHV